MYKRSFLGSKAGETSSSIYMYGTNKPAGLPLSAAQDATLTCSGGTVSGRNTGSLGVLANTFSVSNNASISSTFGVTGLTSLVNAVLSGSLGVTGLTSLGNGTLSVTGNSRFYGALNTESGGLVKSTVDTLGNVSTPGSLTLMTPPALFANGATALTCSFAVPTTVTGMMYQEYLNE